jgi:hypothetical protein
MDFLYPGFDTYIYNFNEPISSPDNLEHPERKLRLGTSVSEYAPRMTCRLRFRDDPRMVEPMTDYVEEHGGKDEWASGLSG